MLLRIADRSADVATGALEPKAQSIFPVKPVDPLMIHEPAFPSQQDVDPKIAIANPRHRQITDPKP